MSDAEAIREIAQPLTGSPNDYDALLGLIGHARIVLLGEASHGTKRVRSPDICQTRALCGKNELCL